MRPRVSPRFLLGVLLSVLPRTATADDPKADVAEGKKLLAEGDALADRGETTEAVIRYKRAFERLLPGIEGISFCYLHESDVVRHRLVRDIIRAYAEDQNG